jgi:hypothetical protein
MADETLKIILKCCLIELNDLKVKMSIIFVLADSNPEKRIYQKRRRKLENVFLSQTKDLQICTGLLHLQGQVQQVKAY